MAGSKGSTWNKWDLHVHTPCSIHHNYKCNHTEDVWEKFILDLERLPQEFKVIGINDYLFIDGYEKVLEYKRRGRLSNLSLILPVLEFRINKFSGNQKFKKVNFHVIFSDTLSPDRIKSQFLNTLSSSYRLSSLGSDHSPSWSGVITKETIVDLGRAIKSTIPPERLSEFSENDFELGFNNINFDENALFDRLNKSSFLRNCYLTAIGKAEWDSFEFNDNSIAEKKDIINKVDFVFTAAENPNNAIKAKNKLTYSNVNDRLLDCSDAHCFSDNVLNKDRIGNCFTWIKATPSFEGLKYCTIENTERIFLGESPHILDKVHKNKTKYIRSIKICKEDSSIKDDWFCDTNLQLNPELIAIIGNKGSGKSALTDILGLLGSSPNYEYYSFLTNSRFKDPKNNLASGFTAEIIWESNEIVPKTLNSEPEKFEIERVKYIPQQFLETICNEYSKHNFEQEIKNVIFSHVAEEDRLNTNNLDDLIEFHTTSFERKLSPLYDSLNEINKYLIRLEEWNTDEYKNRVLSLYRAKMNELESHESIKPKFITAPSQEDSIYKDLNKTISDKIQEKNILTDKDRDNQNKLNTLNLHLANLRNIKDDIANFKSNFVRFFDSIEAKLNSFGINTNDVIQVNINLGELEAKESVLLSQVNHYKTELNSSIDDSTRAKLFNLAEELEGLLEQLSAPEKEYQRYLSEYEEWNNAKRIIIGTKEDSDSLEYYRHILKYLNSPRLKNKIIKLRRNQIKLLIKIYNVKLEYIETYKSLYKPVDVFIKKYRANNDKYNINFDVQFEIRNFHKDFFNFIHQGAKGTFYGIEDGNRQIEDLINKTNLNKISDVVKFVTTIINFLEIDQRFSSNNTRVIKQQLKRDQLEFYNYLFSLQYLFPSYKLELGNISLDKLSPGERGSLLLIFYLFIDKSEIPLIIDQPEENLDNQSVFECLVSYIKEAKKRRQVIIVTHNPNLAVVCDAEQIIVATIDKANKNKIVYNSGAIEDYTINPNIINILEGTLPAFTNRELKYMISKDKYFNSSNI